MKLDWKKFRETPFVGFIPRLEGPHTPVSKPEFGGYTFEELYQIVEWMEENAEWPDMAKAHVKLKRTNRKLEERFRFLEQQLEAALNND